MSIFPCLVTSRNFAIAFLIQIHLDHNTPHIAGHNQLMTEKLNLHHNPISLSFWTNLASNLFNPQPVFSSITAVLLIRPFLLLWTRLQHPKLPPPNKLKQKSNGFSIMLQPIQMQQFVFIKATWSCILIPMQLTSFSQVPGALYAGHFYLSNKTTSPSCPCPLQNGPTHTECKAIRSVVASATEAETAGVFGNSQNAIPIRRTLEALDHPQPPIPIKTDNSTVYSFVNANIRQKWWNTWDMRYNWLRDRSSKKELFIYWDKGSDNNADYFTKHPPPAHHRIQHPKFILKNFHMTKSLFSTVFLTAMVSAAYATCPSCVRVCLSNAR